MELAEGRSFAEDGRSARVYGDEVFGVSLSGLGIPFEGLGALGSHGGGVGLELLLAGEIGREVKGSELEVRDRNRERGEL